MEAKTDAKLTVSEHISGAVTNKIQAPVAVGLCQAYLAFAQTSSEPMQSGHIFPSMCRDGHYLSSQQSP